MKRILLLIIIFASIELFALSCQNSNVTKDKEGYEFYYYPEKNVYYSLEKKNFFYSLDGGKTWDSIVNPSGNDPGTLGEKVVIKSLAEDVYKSNETHRNLYKGKLYNITAGETGVALSAPEVTERKEAEKSKAESKPKAAEEKPKKGLKKFLNKIFGRHDKKHE